MAIHLHSDARQELRFKWHKHDMITKHGNSQILGIHDLKSYSARVKEMNIISYSAGKHPKKLDNNYFQGITLYWHAMRTERARKTQLLLQANKMFEQSGLYSSPQNPTIVRNLTVWGDILFELGKLTSIEQVSFFFFVHGFNNSAYDQIRVLHSCGSF